MNQNGTVAAVIPNWNKAELLKRVLNDLKQQDYALKRNIVIDNSSTDSSRFVATSAGVELLEMERNMGFAFAVNRGIEACETDWVLILNNDVTFGPGWLATLMAEAVKSKAWFAVGKLLSERDPMLLDGTFDAISRGATSWRCGSGKPDGPLWCGRREISFAPLTATLIRRELFNRVGLLDERFESYLEDVDFGLRCAAKHYTGVYVPNAIARHAGSATLGTWHKATVRRIARNQKLLVDKHFRGAPQWPIVVGQLLWGLLALRHGAGMAWLEGRRQGSRLKLGPVQQWSEIQEAVERSESEIRNLQQATGFDLYWRLYFALVRN